MKPITKRQWAASAVCFFGYLAILLWAFIVAVGRIVTDEPPPPKTTSVQIAETVLMMVSRPVWIMNNQWMHLTWGHPLHYAFAIAFAGLYVLAGLMLYKIVSKR